MTLGAAAECTYPQSPIVKNTFVHIPLPHDLQGLLRRRRTRSCPCPWRVEQSHEGHRLHAKTIDLQGCSGLQRKEAALASDSALTEAPLRNWGSLAGGSLQKCAYPERDRCISEAPTDASSARAETSDEAETASSLLEGEEDQNASTVQEGEDEPKSAPDLMPNACDHTMFSDPCAFQVWMEPMTFYHPPEHLDAVYYNGQILGGPTDSVLPVPNMDFYHADQAHPVPEMVASYHYACNEVQGGQLNDMDGMAASPAMAAFHYVGDELLGGSADAMGLAHPEVAPYPYGACETSVGPSAELARQHAPEAAALGYDEIIAGVPADRAQPAPEAAKSSARAGDSPAPVLCLVDALQELPSVGSAGHSRGLCTPCAFTLKGCQAGKDCRFCHACDAGEHKRRKKEKLAIRRTEDQVRRELGLPASGTV